MCIVQANTWAMHIITIDTRLSIQHLKCLQLINNVASEQPLPLWG